MVLHQTLRGMCEEKNRPQPDPEYTCNAEEADTRVWLHIKQTKHKRVLLMSPDTDVYHIGLGLYSANKQVLVQVSAISSREIRLLDLTALVVALQSDPDLVDIPSDILPQVMQTLFVCTGCDYISFFSQLGKATFIRYFFQYANVTSGDPLGTLADVALDGDHYKNGYLAFLRLVGTIYFKKHGTAFDTPTPATHFRNFAKAGKSIQQQHSDWLEDIRQSIWDRIKVENEMVPSNDALNLHWKRSCWVIHMWRQGDRNNLIVQPITNYGWTLSDNKLTVVWDTPANSDAIRDRVKLLLRGCKCATGCVTRRCGCRKNNRQCSEGCECRNGLNISTGNTSATELVEIAFEEEVNMDDTIADDDTDELMD